MKISIKERRDWVAKQEAHLEKEKLRVALEIQRLHQFMALVEKSKADLAKAEKALL